MIIWGSRGREKTIAKGQFHCPRCQQIRQYEQKKIGKYFTLYFIPLFETQKLAEFVECQFCRTPFELSVLEYDDSAAKSLQKFIAMIDEGLEAGLPVQSVYNHLVEEGADESVANNVIAVATNGKLKICKTCQLVYKGSLGYCGNCGQQLSNPE